CPDAIPADSLSRSCSALPARLLQDFWAAPLGGTAKASLRDLSHRFLVRSCFCTCIGFLQGSADPDRLQEWANPCASEEGDMLPPAQLCKKPRGSNEWTKSGDTGPRWHPAP